MFRLLILAAILPTLPSMGEEESVLRRSFAEVAVPVPPFPEGRFEPRPGETVAWIGGTEIVDLDRFGFLEAGMHRAWPDHGLKWRNLAWQGDTVFRQARPMYFYTKKGDPQPGSLPDHRERTEAGIVFLAFGKMESLEGADRVPDFAAAYARILDDLIPLTPRILLVEPTPFFHSGPAAELADRRNEVLSSYIAAIDRIARDRNLRFLRHPMAEWNAGMSDNGIHLNAVGHQALAVELLRSLGYGETWKEVTPSLREAIAHKNLLWQQYYRPSNWAFLFGDRQHVPASRDVAKREERWFVREVDAIPGMLAEAEREISRYAKEAKQ